MAEISTVSSSALPEEPRAHARWELPAYLLIGVLFGIVLIKSEVVSWYRIQEMFRFQSFFMYGVLGSAVATTAIAIHALKTLGLKSLTGKAMRVAAKPWGQGNRNRYWIGGALFGTGWGLAGTCPGPIYALIGYGSSGAIVVLLSALAGARAYASLAGRLPH